MTQPVRRDGVWRDGNRVPLLENGEEFFPAAFAEAP